MFACPSHTSGYTISPIHGVRKFGGSSTCTYIYNPTTGFLDTLQYPVSTSSYQLALQYGYSKGILNSVTDTKSGAVYWTANTPNPRGQITKETLGNGAVTNRAYDAITGWLSSIQSGVSGGSALQNNAFLYDYMGDVTQRQDNNKGLTENFYYDADLRLDHSTLGGATNLQMVYDSGGMGNIVSRSDVAGGTTWTYDSTRKHAVTQAGTGGYAYMYDANGNAIKRNGYTMGWTSYNYLNAANSSGETINFWYGPSRQRWKTQYTGSIGTETTYHVGKLLEKVANGGTIDYRHYIYAGRELVGIYSRTSAGTNTMRYVLSDHQESFVTIDTGINPGTDYVDESFDAFGNRRNGSTWSGAPPPSQESAINTASRRGYTGESALGVSMGLNHLNGRVQDANTGRFLSADPFVRNPGNTQSLNRYSYAINNPLSRVDHSGFDDDGLDEVVVNGDRYSESGGTFSTIGNFLKSFWNFITGTSSSHLTPAQQKISSAGLANPQNLQGNPSAASTNDGRQTWISVDSLGGTQGPQVTVADQPSSPMQEVVVTAQRLPADGISSAAPSAEPPVTLAQSNSATTALLQSNQAMLNESKDLNLDSPTFGTLVSDSLARSGAKAAPYALLIANLIPFVDIGADAVALSLEGRLLLKATPVGSALKSDVIHNAATFMREEAATSGTNFSVLGGDGTTVTLTQLSGDLNGVAGRYEYIVDQAGNLTHQRFVAGGSINGLPNVP